MNNKNHVDTLFRTVIILFNGQYIVLFQKLNYLSEIGRAHV